MSKKEKKGIEKTNWVSSFTLLGKVKLGKNTFKLDAKSEKSNWIYNVMKLGVDCGEKHGVVFANMMGGYGEDQDNVIYCHGKTEDKKDDFKNKIEVDWEDRFDEDILEDIGDMCFLTIGLERKTGKGNGKKGEIYRKKFISAYDAIEYASEHIEDGMMVCVRGNIKYSYNGEGNLMVNRDITSIVAVTDESVKPSAIFKQSVLLDKDSASLKNADKEKGVIYLETKVLDYIKEINGVEIKGQYPYLKTFELAMDFNKEDVCKLIFEKYLKVKRNIRQINFIGEFVSAGAVEEVNFDELDDEIKQLVEAGFYTEEDVVEACSTRGNNECRMILKKPDIKKEEDKNVVQIFDDRYKEDDLIIEGIEVEEDIEDENNDDVNEAISEVEEMNDTSWINDL